MQSDKYYQHILPPALTRVLKILASATLLLVLYQPVQGQKVTEYVSVDSLSVGDSFSYTLVLNKDRLYESVIYPDSANFTGPFEIRNLQRYQVNDFKDSLVYSIQFFGTRDTLVSSLPVQLVSPADTTTLYTHKVPVYFKSVLQGENDEFRPFKPIFDFAAAWWPYLLLLLIAAVAAWYLYTYYRDKAAKPEPETPPFFTPEPFNNPLDQLENKLNRLGNYPLSEPEDFKSFYVQLGDAIREYFERLYRIPALESTSREILYELNRRAVDEELVEKTRDVLREADMVKFAKFTPSQSQANEALQKADAFLSRARDIDRARIEKLRRDHALKNEEKRKQFDKQQNDASKEAESPEKEPEVKKEKNTES